MQSTKSDQTFPKEASLYFERGEIFNVLAKPDTALINYEKAVAIEPDLDEAQLQIATIGIQLREYYRAVSALNRL